MIKIPNGAVPFKDLRVGQEFYRLNEDGSTRTIEVLVKTEPWGGKGANRPGNAQVVGEPYWLYSEPWTLVMLAKGQE